MNLTTCAYIGPNSEVSLRERETFDVVEIDGKLSIFTPPGCGRALSDALLRAVNARADAAASQGGGK